MGRLVLAGSLVVVLRMALATSLALQRSRTLVWSVAIAFSLPIVRENCN